MLSKARTYLAIDPWLATVPGVTIMVAVLGVNLLGEWLRLAIAFEGQAGQQILGHRRAGMVSQIPPVHRGVGGVKAEEWNVLAARCFRTLGKYQAERALTWAAPGRPLTVSIGSSAHAVMARVLDWH